MSDLNAIEEQLKKKCQAEIEEVVNDFIDSILELDKKYSNGINSFYIVKGEKELYIESTSFLTNRLKNMLEKTFLDGMIRKKSKELLDKLELI